MTDKTKKANKPIKVIAITGGKGGVGKTTVSINLATSMAKNGNKVMLLDADLGLANIDILLGLRPQKNLKHVLSGECELQDIILQGPHNVSVIPASSGISEMTKLTMREHGGLISAFSDLDDDLDTLIIDTAAGISDEVISFTRSSQENLLVVCDEPASLTDAYALIKVLSRDHGISHFRFLANMVRTPGEGQALFNKLTRVTEHYLDVVLEFSGAIPFDECLRQSVQQQKPVVDAYPDSVASKCFEGLAKQVGDWPAKGEVTGSMNFFFERLIGDSVQGTII